MRILNHDDVAIALRSGAFSPVRAVQDAYMAHCLGQTALPLSCFLRPLGHQDDRIIALPAHLHGQQDKVRVRFGLHRKALHQLQNTLRCLLLRYKQ